VGVGGGWGSETPGKGEPRPHGGGGGCRARRINARPGATANNLVCSPVKCTQNVKMFQRFIELSITKKKKTCHLTKHFGAWN